MPDFLGQIKLAANFIADLKLRLGARPHVLAYGAVPDGRVVYDGTISAGSVIFSSATAAFTAKHVGRMIYVLGAGASGAILITTIAGYTNATTVTLDAPAGAPVSGAECGFGTDNAASFARAVAAQLQGGNGIFIDGGCYLTSEPLELTAVRWYGPCPHIDIPNAVDLSGKHACIISTANPAVKIAPYPGTALEDMHIHCPGTTQTIDLWEQENYPYQVGLQLGNTGAPLTITGDGDDYAVGGNGAVFITGVAVSGASGWGVYAYKLWGQSLFKCLQLYNCGTVPSGGDPAMHGGIYEASECADIAYDLVHIIGVAAGYSGPKQMGCGIKRGGNGTTLEALDRFKIGPTHSKFSRVMVEGKGKYPILESTAFASSWSQCFFGGAWDEILLGEQPTLSWLNHETVFVACGSFGLDTMRVFSRRTKILGWMAEGLTTLNVYYSYPGLDFTGSSVGVKPHPVQDDGAVTGFPNRIWESLPVARVAYSDAASTRNLVPEFSGGAWTFGPKPLSAIPEVFLARRDQIKLYGGGTCSVVVAVDPGEVYTFGFRHSILTTSFPSLCGCSIKNNTDSSNIVNLVMGASSEETETTQPVLLQFVAPASGAIRITLKTDDSNQTQYSLPVLVRGVRTEVYGGGHRIFLDDQTATIRSESIANGYGHFVKVSR